MNTYLVGGAVRDQILGLAGSDRDWVVVGESRRTMLDAGFRQVGKDFPVFLHPQTGEEYALARTERKRGRGYHGFEFDTGASVTLEQDLERRDLTINAMAQDAQGNLIDPFNGQADMKARVLRHVSPAFREDPLRVLRSARFAARFATLGFSVALETLDFMRQMVRDGEIATLAGERVWAETANALSTDSPQVYFQTLRECGALAVVFPEIDALFGVPQPEKHHPEIDTGVHTMMVLEQAARLSGNPVVRFAALTHDLGKGTTPRAEWPSHRGHEAASVRLLDGFCERLPLPNDYRDLAMLVAQYHGHCHRALELRPASVLKLLESTDAFRRPERFAEFLTACEADSRGRTGFEASDYPQAGYLRRALHAANSVEAAQHADKGLSGREIGQKIRDERQRAIKQFVASERLD